MTNRMPTMHKLELLQQRTDLLKELGDQENIPSVQRRMEIQRQLGEVGQALKRINSDEAIRAKAEADERKARGREEQAANLARSAANRADAAPAKKPGVPAQESAPGKLTRGEYLLKNANQMLRKIETIKSPLPFTVDLYNALVAFVAQQRIHVRDRASARGAAEPADVGPDQEAEWTRTWQSGKTGLGA